MLPTELLSGFQSSPEGSIILLHGPEGTGLTPRQWEEVAQVMEASLRARQHSYSPALAATCPVPDMDRSSLHVPSHPCIHRGSISSLSSTSLGRVWPLETWTRMPGLCGTLWPEGSSSSVLSLSPESLACTVRPWAHGGRKGAGRDLPKEGREMGHYLPARCEAAAKNAPGKILGDMRPPQLLLPSRAMLAGLPVRVRPAQCPSSTVQGPSVDTRCHCMQGNG